MDILLTSLSSDTDGDGYPDSMITYTYDSDGNLNGHYNYDTDGDGYPDSINTDIDYFLGGEGNDTFKGSLSDDVLVGGEGRDRVDYRHSNYPITGNLSANIATGGDAKGDIFDSIESLDGSQFNDLLIGDTNANRLYGFKGDDTLVGNDGDDYLSGQHGADSLEGRAGKDRLLGGSGADNLMGDADNDFLAGGKGDDSLSGTSLSANRVGEIDRLQGNSGADTFVLGTDNTAFYDDGDNSSNGVADYALILDFDPTEDLIQLSGTETYYLDADPQGTLSGMGVFMENDGTAGFSSEDELVAVLKDSTLTAGVIDNSTAGFELV